MNESSIFVRFDLRRAGSHIGASAAGEFDLCGAVRTGRGVYVGVDSEHGDSR